MLKELLKPFKQNDIIKFIYYKLFHPQLSFSNDSIEEYYLLNNTQTPWLKYKTSEFDKQINDLFNQWAEIAENEYFIYYNKACLIEPYHGWLIVNKNKIIKESLPYGIFENTPLPHHIFYKRKKTVKIQKAVSIRYNWLNYWHFYNDVLGQLYLLEKLNFDKRVPIIIPKEAISLNYVKEFFKTDYAKMWHWILQDKETYINLESVYLCRNISNIKDHFIYSAGIFKKNMFIENLYKRIFITRRSSRGRYLRNSTEIIALLKKHEFEIIECDDLSIEQQIKIFASAKIIIGIHGAGLTNIIYRYPMACMLIEIFPPDNTAAHYYWLAKEFNFEYKAILGKDLIDGSFTVLGDKLISAINTHIQYN